MHVKLCLTINWVLGAEIMVLASICLQVLHRLRWQEKVPAGDTESCRSELRTRVSLIFLLCRNETKGLTEKMEDVSGSFLRRLKLRLTISLTLKLKGWKVNTSGTFWSETIAGGGLKVSKRGIMEAFWRAVSKRWVGYPRLRKKFLISKPLAWKSSSSLQRRRRRRNWE